MKHLSMFALLLAVSLLSTGCRPNIGRLITRSAVQQQIRHDQQNRQIRQRVHTRPRSSQSSRTRSAIDR